MSKFAMVTETFDAYAFLQFTAAQFLHRWLVRLAKTGTVIEVHLEEFKAWVEKCRGKSYSWRWVKEAFKKLIELGLVDICFKYNSKIYRIRVWKEGDFCPLNFSSKNAQKTYKIVQETSKKTASTPDIASSSLYRNKENTNTPPTNHPVVEKNFSSEKENTEETTNQVETVLQHESNIEKFQNLQPAVEHKSFDSEKIEAIKSLGIKPNFHILQIAHSVTTEIFKNALAAVEEQMKQKKVFNVGGMLVRAFKESWSPSTNQKVSASSQETENKSPFGIAKNVKEEFSTWYAWARLAGVVLDIPENYLPVVMHEPQVKIDEKDPYTKAPYTMMNWREAQKLFPMPQE